MGSACVGSKLARLISVFEFEYATTKDNKYCVLSVMKNRLRFRCVEWSVAYVSVVTVAIEPQRCLSLLEEVC